MKRPDNAHEERFYIEDSVHGRIYFTDEQQFLPPNWEPRLDSWDYLRELMDLFPERFRGCRIQEKA